MRTVRTALVAAGLAATSLLGACLPDTPDLPVLVSDPAIVHMTVNVNGSSDGDSLTLRNAGEADSGPLSFSFDTGAFGVDTACDELDAGESCEVGIDYLGPTVSESPRPAYLPEDVPQVLAIGFLTVTGEDAPVGTVVKVIATVGDRGVPGDL